MFQGAMCHCMNNFASISVYHQHRCKSQIARRFSQSLVMYSTANDAQNGANDNDPVKSTGVEWIIGTDGAWCRKLEHCIKP